MAAFWSGFSADIWFASSIFLALAPNAISSSDSDKYFESLETIIKKETAKSARKSSLSKNANFESLQGTYGRARIRESMHSRIARTALLMPPASLGVFGVVATETFLRGASPIAAISTNLIMPRCKFLSFSSTTSIVRIL